MQLPANFTVVEHKIKIGGYIQVSHVTDNTDKLQVAKPGETNVELRWRRTRQASNDNPSHKTLSHNITTTSSLSRRSPSNCLNYLIKFLVNYIWTLIGKTDWSIYYPLQLKIIYFQGLIRQRYCSWKSSWISNKNFPLKQLFFDNHIKRTQILHFRCILTFSRWLIKLLL